MCKSREIMIKEEMRIEGRKKKNRKGQEGKKENNGRIRKEDAGTREKEQMKDDKMGMGDEIKKKIR